MKHLPNRVAIIFLLSILLFGSLELAAQKNTVRKGTVQRIKVHGKALEGNLSGDPSDREVSIYLPPGYAANSSRRYPVVYFLHGYTDDDSRFYGSVQHWMKLVPILDSVFAAGQVQEMIFVTPNAYTRFQGSMYSNSVTTGNWEDYIAKELVAYMDSHFRTLANAGGRGLSGHSMGGYGALRIGQKYPDVFSCIYLLSPCCLSSGPNPVQVPASYLRADSIKTYEEFEKAGFGIKAMFASAAAWSPNPNNPPFFIDLPVRNGQWQPSISDKWSANRPLTTIDQYIINLRKLKGFAFDAGTRDQGIAASIKVLDEVLTQNKVNHIFDIYEGDHINRVAERIQQKMLQFFSENLSRVK